MKSTIIAAYIAALASSAIAGHYAVTSSDELLQGCPNGYVDKNTGDCKPFTLRVKRTPYGPWENYEVSGAYHLPDAGSNGGAKHAGSPWGVWNPMWGHGPVVPQGHQGPPNQDAGGANPANGGWQHGPPARHATDNTGSHGPPGGYGGDMTPGRSSPGSGPKKHHGSNPGQSYVQTPIEGGNYQGGKDDEDCDDSENSLPVLGSPGHRSPITKPSGKPGHGPVTPQPMGGKGEPSQGQGSKSRGDSVPSPTPSSNGGKKSGQESSKSTAKATSNSKVIAAE